MFWLFKNVKAVRKAVEKPESQYARRCPNCDQRMHAYGNKDGAWHYHCDACDRRYFIDINAPAGGSGKSDK